MQKLLLPVVLLFCSLVSGCAGLAQRDPLQVDLAGIRPLPGEELEVRFMVRLRVLNPNDSPVSYRGLALALELDATPLARGVSDQSGEVPRFGEVLLEVPMTVSALSATRQLWKLSQARPTGRIPYRLYGKLASGPFGSRRFSSEGTLEWPPVR